jgi:hypothetical protein
MRKLLWATYPMTELPSQNVEWEFKRTIGSNTTDVHHIPTGLHVRVHIPTQLFPSLNSRANNPPNLSKGERVKLMAQAKQLALQHVARWKAEDATSDQEILADEKARLCPQPEHTSGS